jgi:hypothetical protein
MERDATIRKMHRDAYIGKCPEMSQNVTIETEQDLTIGIPIRATHTRLRGRGNYKLLLLILLKGVGGVIHICDYLLLSACVYEKNKKIDAINALT